jgi:CheY-like chemotaxis protein
MDGYELAQLLRAEERLRDVHLVALTGYAAPDDLARSARAGFDLHLTKPANMAFLEQVIAAGPGRAALEAPTVLST